MKLGALVTAIVAARHLRLGVDREPALGAPEESEGSPAEGPEDTSTATEAKLQWIEKTSKVNKALFSIACRFKHKRDIRGLAENLMRSEESEADDFQEFIENVQKENVATMKESCGLISSDSWKRCRDACSSRWHTKTGSNKFVAEKGTCVELCENKHKNWESDCKLQAENLKNLYTVHRTDAMKGSSCQNLHCRRFPDILAGNTADDMKKTRDENCKIECTPERITRQCKQEFLMDKDFKLMDHEEECHGEKKVELETCQNELEEKVSADHDQCESDVKATCESQYEECMSKGDKGDEFCASRQNMCEEQVTAECVGNHKKALNTGTDACLATFDEDKKTCAKERIAQDEENTLAKCEETEGPKCADTCEKNCNVDNLQSCLGELASTAGATDEFCDNLWEWLYNSEEVNPKNGDPVPL